MNPLTIRELAEHDLDALLALYTELHRADAPLPARAHVLEVWRAMLRDPKLYCLGGFAGEQLVTSCTLVVVPNLTRACRPYGLIENVVTTTAQRCRGFGRQILQQACALAWEHGCYKAMLLTGRQDEATLSFYESAGFDRHSKQAFYAAAPT